MLYSCSDKTASALRKAYLATFDYTNMEFDKALRAFLSRLVLPAETEKIDRLIEAFAIRYHQNNPTLFAKSGTPACTYLMPFLSLYADNRSGRLFSADTAYVLAFGLLMLHTDAHNPNMKKEQKMTKEQFMRNMKGIDDGADLPTEYLSKLYDRISFVFLFYFIFLLIRYAGLRRLAELFVRVQQFLRR
jgi:brefeldin A-inhibited guanine nucleotide-exchange protein